jgi:hypothetical protein
VVVPQLLGFQSPLGTRGAVAAIARFVYGLQYCINAQQSAREGEVDIIWPDLNEAACAKEAKP